jgi:hypothetical protein
MRDRFARREEKLMAQMSVTASTGIARSPFRAAAKQRRPAPVRKLHVAFKRKNQNRPTFNASGTTLNSLPPWLAAGLL